MFNANFANAFLPPRPPTPFSFATSATPNPFSSYSAFTTPRNSYSSYPSFPMSSHSRRSNSSWGSGYNQHEGQLPGQRNDLQYAYRPSFQQMHQNPFRNFFRRPSQTHATSTPRTPTSSGSNRPVPRSAGYAYVSASEYNNRAREFNRYSNGLLRPILINDYDGRRAASRLSPDDWNQLMYMPAEDVEELCDFYRINTFGRSLNECRIAYLKFIGAKGLARHLERRDHYTPDEDRARHGIMHESEYLF